MASGSMIRVPSSMTVSSGIQVIFRVLSEQYERLEVWYSWWKGYIKYVVQIAITTISFGIRVILRVLPQQFETLSCWCYWREGFMMYATEMASSGLKNVRRFMTISSGNRIILRSWRQQFEALQRRYYWSGQLVKASLSWPQVALYILWLVNPFLGRELEANNDTAAVALHRAVNTPLQK